MLDVLLILSYAVVSAGGLLVLKLHVQQAQAAVREGTFLNASVVFVALGLALYILAFLVWLAVVARQPLSVAYPSAVGVTMVVTAALAATVLGESFGLRQVFGTALVLAGVAALARA